METNIKQKIIELAKIVISLFDKNPKLEATKEGDQWRLDVQSKNKILENSELIKSIQHIIRVLVHKSYPEDRTHFLLDINNFRKNREKIIKYKIPKIAEQMVLDSGKTIILTGLSGYERLIIHKILAESKGITTNSIGLADQRKLLIMPTSEFGSGGMDEAVVININRLVEMESSQQLTQEEF